MWSPFGPRVAPGRMSGSSSVRSSAYASHARVMWRVRRNTSSTRTPFWAAWRKAASCRGSVVAASAAAGPRGREEDDRSAANAAGRRLDSTCLDPPGGGFSRLTIRRGTTPAAAPSRPGGDQRPAARSRRARTRRGRCARSTWPRARPGAGARSCFGATPTSRLPCHTWACRVAPPGRGQVVGVNHVVQALAAAEAPVAPGRREVGRRPRPASARRKTLLSVSWPASTSGISTHALALPRSERVPSRAAMRTW